MRLSRWIPFGTELAARRESLGRRYGRRVTQKDIAHRAGITEKQLSRIETAISGTDYDTVVRLAGALEYESLEECNRLFKLAGFAYQAEVAANLVAEGMPKYGDDDVEGMLRDYRSASLEVQSAVRVLLRAAVGHDFGHFPFPAEIGQLPSAEFGDDRRSDLRRKTVETR